MLKSFTILSCDHLVDIQSGIDFYMNAIWRHIIAGFGYGFLFLKIQLRYFNSSSFALIALKAMDEGVPKKKHFRQNP